MTFRNEVWRCLGKYADNGLRNFVKTFFMKLHQLLSLVVLILSTSVSVAQNCEGYLSFQKGTKMQYIMTDRKGKQSGMLEYAINDVVKSDGGITADINSRFADEKGKELSSGHFTITCNGDGLVMDMRSLLSDQALAGFKDMTATVQGGNMEIPFGAAVGSTLPDAMMHMELSSSGSVMSVIDMKITNRKVLAKEDITTPAGTFSCIKIGYDNEMKMTTMGIGIPVNTHSETWFSKKVGTVRSDTYSKDMKPAGNMVLSSITQ